MICPPNACSPLTQPTTASTSYLIQNLPREAWRAKTAEQAIQALEERWMAVNNLLQTSLNGDGKIKRFKPDVYSFLAYLIRAPLWEWGVR